MNLRPNKISSAFDSLTLRSDDGTRLGKTRTTRWKKGDKILVTAINCPTTSRCHTATPGPTSGARIEPGTCFSCKQLGLGSGSVHRRGHTKTDNIDKIRVYLIDHNIGGCNVGSKPEQALEDSDFNQVLSTDIAIWYHWLVNEKKQLSQWDKAGINTHIRSTRGSSKLSCLPRKH